MGDGWTDWGGMLDWHGSVPSCENIAVWKLLFMGVRIGKWICDFSGSQSRQRDAFE